MTRRHSRIRAFVAGIIICCLSATLFQVYRLHNLRQSAASLSKGDSINDALDPGVESITVSNIPAGTTVSYWDGDETVYYDAGGRSFTFTNFTMLESLNFTSISQSDIWCCSFLWI